MLDFFDKTVDFLDIENTYDKTIFTRTGRFGNEHFNVLWGVGGSAEHYGGGTKYFDLG